VITLTGETDLVSVAGLSALLSGQLADGTRELTINASGLRFADTASIRALVLAARTLNERGGRLVLLHPQQPVAKMLELLGADDMFTIVSETPGQPEPEASAGQSRPSAFSEELAGLGSESQGQDRLARRQVAAPRPISSLLGLIWYPFRAA
jgi:anti-anti-sigma factor